LIPQRPKKYPLNGWVKLRFFCFPCETNILHSAIRIEVTDSGITLTVALADLLDPLAVR